jgi:predicted nucleic acid-binding protein
LKQRLTVLCADAILVTPMATVRGVATDLADDLVLATAIAGQASFLVTGDKWLLDLESHQDIAIVSPRDFLSFLGELPGRH